MSKVLLAAILTIAFSIAGIFAINKMNLNENVVEENLLATTDPDESAGQLETPVEKAREEKQPEEELKPAEAKIEPVVKTNVEVKMFNHRTKEDIFFRPEGKVAKMFSKDGKLLWSKTLDGEVIGKAKQVDTYKNGKYQALFSTVATTYCIDILGRDVKGYPKKNSSSQ